MHKFVNNTATAVRKSHHSLLAGRVQDTAIAIMSLKAWTSPLLHFPITQSIISVIETIQWAVLCPKPEPTDRLPLLTFLGFGVRM